jgi:acyl-CoA hydrolase
MTEIVMPGDANPMGTAFGGKIMQWIDIAAGIAAMRAVGAAVTASVDSIEFNKPIMVGDVVTLKAAVNKVWNTSMEVGVQVTFQSRRLISIGAGGMFMRADYYRYYLAEPVQACRAYLTFVAVDDNGKRIEIDHGQLPPTEGEEWVRRAEEAEVRRAIRLANRKGK